MAEILCLICCVYISRWICPTRRTQRSVKNNAWQQSADGSLHQVEQATCRTGFCWCCVGGRRRLETTLHRHQHLCLHHEIPITQFTIYSKMPNTTNTVKFSDITTEFHISNLQTVTAVMLHYSCYAEFWHTTVHYFGISYSQSSTQLRQLSMTAHFHCTVRVTNYNILLQQPLHCVIHVKLGWNCILYM